MECPTTRHEPTVPQTFIDAEMEKDPASAAAEYLAEFRTDIEAYVSREAVEACIEWGVHERGPLPGHRYVGFVDPSGGSSDSFTLGIAHKEGEPGVLDCLREVRPPFSPEAVVRSLLMYARHTASLRSKVTAMQAFGQPKSSAKCNIKYESSEQPKGLLYLNALPLINSGKVRLLANTRLISQLVGLQRTTARGGRDSIDHARARHDDVANVAAGVLLAATANLPATGADWSASVGPIGKLRYTTRNCRPPGWAVTRR